MSVPSAPPVQLSPSAVFSTQRTAFASDSYPTAAVRRERLRLLEEAIFKRQDELADAMDRDFGGRSRNEVLFSEIFVSLNAVRHARARVDGWMATRRRELGWQMQPARAYVLPQPLGVIGIVSPWNYPLFLAAAPLAGALAAGNRAMLKLSETTPATSELMAAVLRETFPEDLVAVITGDAETGREFVALPFDHLLFTGSTAVGREVMRAASDHLTPVTLELGGKSPAIIAPDASLKRAAKEIAYGKLLNAGQVCLAVDYVLAPADRMRSFVDAFQDAANQYFPNAAANPEYTSIINDRHLARLNRYVDEARARGVEVIGIGPEAAGGGRKMQPVILIDPPDDLPVMREEIFGPILPVKPYRSLGDAIRYVNERPRPLALYVFSRDRASIDQVLTRTISGGVCVNETILHVACEDLPFGGVGASGIGHYHGQEGFDTFSKLKPVFQRRWPGISRMLRPPYTHMHQWLRRVLIG